MGEQDPASPAVLDAAQEDESFLAPIEVTGMGGGTIAVTVSRQTAAAAQVLPYEPDRYFADPSSALQIPLSALTLSHARPSGIANAVGLMQSAYVGAGAKRVPISVRPLENGRYLVVDGNSTATIAALAGWPDIPGNLVSEG